MSGTQPAQIQAPASAAFSSSPSSSSSAGTASGHSGQGLATAAASGTSATSGFGHFQVEPPESVFTRVNMNYAGAGDATKLLQLQLHQLQEEASAAQLFDKCAQISALQKLAEKISEGLEKLDLDEIDIRRQERALWLTNQLRRVRDQLKPLEQAVEELREGGQERRAKTLATLQHEIQMGQRLAAAFEGELAKEGMAADQLNASGGVAYGGGSNVKGSGGQRGRSGEGFGGAHG